MRAVSFDVSLAGFALARTLGRVWDGACFGTVSGVGLRETSLPPLPGDGWARLRVLKAGICGTDIANLTFASSPAMEPFGSFPAVLGHEIVAEVVELAPGVGGIEIGQRVAVDPLLSCRVRGWGGDHECPSCRAGQHATCEMAGEEGRLEVGGEPLARGLTLGYHRSLPGGWGEEMLAHRSQLFAVDDALEDHAAALIEPLSVGMHAVLNAPPNHPSEPVLVVGSGPIALATVWALRATGFGGELFAQTKRSHEARLARLMGASQVVSPGEEAREALVGTGSQAYMPLVGEEVYAGGGFPLIYDCVGSARSLTQSLRYASPRGRIVLLGCAARIPRLDLTFLWARELEVRGFVGYGLEHFRGATAHTFAITHQLLLETGTPVQEMVTHVYPLRHYRDALRATANRRRFKSVKVLLDPTTG